MLHEAWVWSPHYTPSSPMMYEVESIGHIINWGETPSDTTPREGGLIIGGDETRPSMTSRDLITDRRRQLVDERQQMAWLIIFTYRKSGASVRRATTITTVDRICSATHADSIELCNTNTFRILGTRRSISSLVDVLVKYLNETGERERERQTDRETALCAWISSDSCWAIGETDIHF